MSPAPLYEQIKQHITDLIETGELGPNDRLPSETDLAAEFQVARMTVHRAIKDLKDSGVVTRIAGVGTFVAETQSSGQLIAVNNIADEIRSRNSTYSAVMVQNARERASRAVAQQLEIDPSSPVFHSIIVHMENGIPLQLEERFVPQCLLPGYGDVDFSRTTPNEYLMKHAPLQKFEHRVKSILAEPEVRKLLRINKHEPCLLLLRRTWSRRRVVSFARMTYPGSRYEFLDRVASA
jgi:GntR family transcriptional regulator, histidine utilization repressor